MERVCFRLQVRPDRLAEYVDRHAEVWGEMLEALHRAGWRNYSLFLDADGTLIGYFETQDVDEALRRMDESEVNDRWQAEMAPFFEALHGRRPDQGFVRLPEIFNLEDQLAAVRAGRDDDP